MSYFYGSMQGNKGGVTRCGTKKSGMTAHIRGWNIGVRVNIRHDEKSGKDFYTIYETGGSNGGSETLIADLGER